MPSFKIATKEVRDLLQLLMQAHECYTPHLESEIKIDLVFAFCDRDDENNPLNYALTKNGVRALGIARKVSPKDRAKGMGDAEIALDADWWKEASEKEQAALLDHELYHIIVQTNKAGDPIVDDFGRPKLRMRKHDFEFGWFKVIAERHGRHSAEQQQAKAMFDSAGQYFWPTIAKSIGWAPAGGESA